MKTQITKYLTITFVISHLLSFSQKSDFIVTEENDTIYVEKFNIKGEKIRVKINGEKKKYPTKNIKSAYISNSNQHLEKVKLPFLVNTDYESLDFFILRLTNGKVKIFKYSNSSGIAYYISILDSKLEVLTDGGKLRLNNNTYNILKLYLHSNEEIVQKLNKMFLSHKKQNEESIIKLSESI